MFPRWKSEVPISANRPPQQWHLRQWLCQFCSIALSIVLSQIIIPQPAHTFAFRGVSCACLPFIWVSVIFIGWTDSSNLLVDCRVIDTSPLAPLEGLRRRPWSLGMTQCDCDDGDPLNCTVYDTLKGLAKWHVLERALLIGWSRMQTCYWCVHSHCSTIGRVIARQIVHNIIRAEKTPTFRYL